MDNLFPEETRTSREITGVYLTRPAHGQVVAALFGVTIEDLCSKYFDGQLPWDFMGGPGVRTGK